MRFLSTALILLSYARAQTSPSVVVASGSVGPNPVSPSTVTTNRADSLGKGPPSLLDVPALPTGKTTLVGGTIRSVDHIRDRLTLDIFGGGHTTILFDERTRVFRGTEKGSLDSLKNGERASLDTTLDGTRIFARNIRVAAEAAAGQGDGQVVAFEPATGILTLRDTLSPQPVKMRLAGGASILRGDHAATTADLRPGTLVTLIFAPGSDKSTVRQVSILASPGTTFGFSGRVEYLDLHRNLLTLVDPRDNKSYEVYFDSSRSLMSDVQEGADVSVQATFDGSRYEASAVTVNSASAQ
jgi:hypothetical protein